MTLNDTERQNRGFYGFFGDFGLRYKFTGCSKKTDTQFYFGDNFGNSAPILTILSLLQAEIYGA